MTAFTFQLHPVAEIYGGPMFFELSDGPDILGYFNDFSRTAPRDYGGFPAFQIAPPLPFVPEDRVGEPFVAVVSCWSGSTQDGEKFLRGFRDVANSVAEHVGPMPYAALNGAFDALVPRGLQHYWKAAFVGDLVTVAGNAATIKTCYDQTHTKFIKPGKAAAPAVRIPPPALATVSLVRVRGAWLLAGFKADEGASLSGLSRALVAALLVPALGMVILDEAVARLTGQCHWVDVPVKGGGLGNIRYQRKQVCPAGATRSSSSCGYQKSRDGRPVV